MAKLLPKSTVLSDNKRNMRGLGSRELLSAFICFKGDII